MHCVRIKKLKDQIQRKFYKIYRDNVVSLFFEILNVNTIYLMKPIGKFNSLKMFYQERKV